MVPREHRFHQHFNVGAEPARYLALKPFNSRKFPGLRKQWGTSESVKLGGDQIEYEDGGAAHSRHVRRRARQARCGEPDGQRVSGGLKNSRFQISDSKIN